MAAEKRSDYKNLDTELDIIMGKILRNVNWKFGWVLLLFFGGLVAGWTRFEGNLAANGKGIINNEKRIDKVDEELRNRQVKINSIDLLKNDMNYIKQDIGKISDRLDRYITNQEAVSKEILKELRKP